MVVEITDQFRLLVPHVKKYTWRIRIRKMMGLFQIKTKNLPTSEALEKLSNHIKKTLDSTARIDFQMFEALEMKFGKKIPVEIIGQEYFILRKFVKRNDTWYHKKLQKLNNPQKLCISQYQPNTSTWVHDDLSD